MKPLCPYCGYPIRSETKEVRAADERVYSKNSCADCGKSWLEIPEVQIQQR